MQIKNTKIFPQINYSVQFWRDLASGHNKSNTAPSREHPSLHLGVKETLLTSFTMIGSDSGYM